MFNAHIEGPNQNGAYRWGNTTPSWVLVVNKQLAVIVEIRRLHSLRIGREIGIFVPELGRFTTFCHRAPGGSWVVGIPTRER